MKNEPNYYAIIPAIVRYDNELSSSEKLYYGEVTALSNKHGYCYATNGYFSELYQVSKVTISRWTSRLEKKGYISTELIRDGKEIVQRRIFITEMLIGINKNVNRGINKNDNTPINKNVKDNSTSINNIKYNNNIYVFDDFYELIWKTYKTINNSGKAEGKEKAKKLNEENLIKLYESVLQYKDYSQFEGYKHCLIATFINKKRYLDDWSEVNDDDDNFFNGSQTKVLE